ncbi:MAG TPA: enoyl-CoA hydratase/isomerase family protein [Gammaproteobacteria bacterium]
MTWNTVEVERRGDIAIVTMARPESLNAFSDELTRELTDVARSFHEAHDVHAVILTGAGRGFCGV